MEQAVAILSVEQAGELEYCEARIRAGLKTFVEVGKALAKIRDSRLYRQNFETFETYCSERWGFEKRTAYQFIAGARVVANVRNCAHLPENEAQARPLTRLEPEEQKQVWEHITSSYEPETITGGLVKDEVARYLQQAAKPAKTQNRQDRPEPEPGEFEGYELPPLFDAEDATGINLALQLARSHRWIYELGFRRTDREGFGGRLYNPDLLTVHTRLGGDAGVRILAALMGIAIPPEQRGAGLIRCITNSDFFSTLEVGINSAYNIEDVDDVAGIESRGPFMAFFGISPKGSALQHRIEMLRVFAGLRTIEDKYYKPD